MKKIVFLLLVLCAGGASAQQWPAKAMRFIVPNSVGTSPDIFSRLLADGLAQGLGQPVVVENIANGLVGAERGAKAAPDGYTMTLGSIVALVTNLYNFKSIPYDPAKDFVPAAMLVDDAPYSIAVNVDVPAKTLGELFALDKAKPGALSLASDFGLAGIVTRWMIRASKAQIVYVPYKEVSQQLQDLVAGRAQVTILSAVSLNPAIQAGKVRIIAMTSRTRFPGMENIPAANETLPGFEAGGWFAPAFPTGTPAAVIERLNRENNAFVKRPDIQQRMRATGFAASGQTNPKEVAEFVRVERERWGKIFRDVGIEPQ